MELQIIEKVFNKSKSVRLARESMYINYFESKLRGMNKKSWYSKKQLNLILQPNFILQLNLILQQPNLILQQLNFILHHINFQPFLCPNLNFYFIHTIFKAQFYFKPLFKT